MITQQMLKEELEYRDGKFYWRVPRQGRQILFPAGSLDSEGYLRVKINGKSYMLHRLAWLYFYGEWPSGVIDHINRKRADNRIENLRDVSQMENSQNNYISLSRRLPSHIVRHHWGYRVDMMLDGCKVRSKKFETVEEALEAKAAMT